MISLDICYCYIIIKAVRFINYYTGHFVYVPNKACYYSSYHLIERYFRSIVYRFKCSNKMKTLIFMTWNGDFLK